MRRLAILPGTSHIGVMAEAKLLAQVAIPFLDDVTPAIPPGFFKSTDINGGTEKAGAD